MKKARHNKILGIALGERSLTVAEIIAGEGRPSVRKAGEMAYPEGGTPSQPAALGAALSAFLRENDFSARTAVIGLPARWIVAKLKEVPPADEATISAMLRLQAEGEFASDLGPLTYDYVPNAKSSTQKSLMLVGTPTKYIEAATAIGQAAKVKVISVVSSAMALGDATGNTGANRSTGLVLDLQSTATELSARVGGTAVALRGLRAPSAQPAFVGELRRAVSSLPSNGTRELLVWDGANLADAIGGNLGATLRRGQLADLGVDGGEQFSNGSSADAGRFASAIALAISANSEEPSLDFLHSRLAAPRQSLIPRWVWPAAAAVLLSVGGIVYAYHDLQKDQDAVAKLQAQLDGSAASVKSADAFVSKVSFAQKWHGGDARYLACLRDLTLAIPDDGQTYATSVIIRETARSDASKPGAAQQKPETAAALTGLLSGRASDQQSVQRLLDQMKRSPGFESATLGGTQDAGRTREVTFTITFSYRPTGEAVSVSSRQPLTSNNRNGGNNQRRGNFGGNNNGTNGGTRNNFGNNRNAGTNGGR